MRDGTLDGAPVRLRTLSPDSTIYLFAGDWVYIFPHPSPRTEAELDAPIYAPASAIPSREFLFIAGQWFRKRNSSGMKQPYVEKFGPWKPNPVNVRKGVKFTGLDDRLISVTFY